MKEFLYAYALEYFDYGWIVMSVAGGFIGTHLEKRPKFWGMIGVIALIVIPFSLLFIKWSR